MPCNQFIVSHRFRPPTLIQETSHSCRPSVVLLRVVVITNLRDRFVTYYACIPPHVAECVAIVELGSVSCAQVV